MTIDDEPHQIDADTEALTKRYQAMTLPVLRHHLALAREEDEPIVTALIEKSLASFVKCRIDGCEDRTTTAKLCAHHYHIEKRYGSCVCTHANCNDLSVLKGRCAKHQQHQAKKPRVRNGDQVIRVQYADGIHD